LLSSGTRLGPYEIVARIGAGGMGEVWRATDTRLDRAVALKILPQEFASNAQLKIRFEREARTISQLNHPNICTLHDVGHENGTDFLVMELVEGESLADRLSRGRLEIAEVIRYGAQIADALERAHRAGVVHRDLKPGNVMLTHSGAKLLDFGLAKSGVFQVRVEEATQHKPLTQEGTILGTFQYMAPEQLEGLDADARTDIFALGALLYEMATGTRAFQGSTRTSLIASIVSSHPAPISAVAPMSPPALDHIVRKCLEKDPLDRWQSAHDVAEQLRWISEAGSQAGAAPAVALRRKSRERLAWAIAVIALLLAGAGALLWVRSTAVRPVPLHASITEPPQVRFRLIANDAATLTISPDGTTVTFLAQDATGRRQLWLRRLDEADARPLSGTEEASNPFWSPDSRFIAFFANGKLQKVDVRGGPPLVICEVALNPRRGSWNRDDVIVFSPTSLGPIHRVSAAGGRPQPVTQLNAATSETTHRWATFLPDGNHFLYLAGTHVARAQSEVNAVYVGSLEGGSPKLLLRVRSNVEYSMGHLLYVRDNVLVAQAFDPDALELTGDPISIAERVAYGSSFFFGAFSVSPGGVLVYRAGLGAREDVRMEWLDAAGKPVVELPKMPLAGEMSVSPDDGHVAMACEDRAGGIDIWMIDIARRLPSRFTFMPADERFPVWSPDGSTIVFSGLNGIISDLYVKPTSGTTKEKLLFSSPVHKTPTSWSADGKYLLVNTLDARKGQQDVAVYSFEKRTLDPLVATTEFDENGGDFSPDSRWIVYVSTESGRSQAYITSFPEPSAKLQVSAEIVEGPPRWRGNQIFFRGDGAVHVVDVIPKGQSIEIGGSRVLFRDDTLTNVKPSSDGQHFIAAKTSEESVGVPVTLVMNWNAKLARK